MLMKNLPAPTAITITILVVGSLFCSTANAQTNTDQGVIEQLKVQLKLSDTVLVVQQDGIVAVPPDQGGQTTVPESTYREGALHPVGKFQVALTGPLTARKYPVGDKVHVTEITASIKKDKIVLLLQECAACNGNQLEYLAFLAFQFPKGYLTNCDVAQIQDVVSQVLTIDARRADTQTETPSSDVGNAQTPPPQSQALTNDDVLKMVRAKFSDAYIIDRIKSSNCQFDTRTDSQINLKNAGVSESVLKAMTEAPAPAAAPICNEYSDCMTNGKAAFQAFQWDQAFQYFQAASSLDPSKGETWAWIGYTYFKMGRYDDSLAMSDKALQLGATLFGSVCLRNPGGCRRGLLQLSLAEISLLDSTGRKTFSARPADVASQGTQLFSSGTAAYASLQVSHKAYDLFLIPFGLSTCAFGEGVICPEPGFTEQKVFSDQVHELLTRIAAGKLH